MSAANVKLSSQNAEKGNRFNAIYGLVDAFRLTGYETPNKHLKMRYNFFKKHLYASNSLKSVCLKCNQLRKYLQNHLCV